MADARVCEIPGAGHFGASGFTPEPIAHALIGFLAESPAERRP